MKSFLDRKRAGIYVIDVQEKLFPLCDRHHEVLEKMILALRGAALFDLLFFVTEQYPKGLGHTLTSIKNHLPKDQQFFSKTSFSGYVDSHCREAFNNIKAQQWILIGIETHICVLQTAKDLLIAGKEVIVLNDATTSRSLFDFSTALGEMRDIGVRISSTETVLYELLRDASRDEFDGLLRLIKNEA